MRSRYDMQGHFNLGILWGRGSGGGGGGGGEWICTRRRRRGRGRVPAVGMTGVGSGVFPGSVSRGRRRRRRRIRPRVKRRVPWRGGVVGRSTGRRRSNGREMVGGSAAAESRSGKRTPFVRKLLRTGT